MEKTIERPIRKNYEAIVDMEFVQNLMEVVNKNEIECIEFEGCLIDNYIVYGADKLSIGRIKPRKYMIIAEEYVNCWTSQVRLIMTDSESILEKYEEIFNDVEED